MDSIEVLLENARKAGNSLKVLSDSKRKNFLLDLSERLQVREAELLSENRKDLERMPDGNSRKDRLRLTSERVKALATAVIDVSQLEDPTGRMLSEKHLENGLIIQHKTVSLGVVGIIYESRPNVTVDVAALCIRSGNACVLRGGSDALYTNIFLVNLIQDLLMEHGMDTDCVQLLPVDRLFIAQMLKAVKYIDVIIPRGSQKLIEYVRENSRVPVIETGAGVCHTYVEESANLDKAKNIVVNAKVSRPSVCNALDTVLIDKKIAAEFIEMLAPELLNYKVEIFAEKRAHTILEQLNYPLLVAAGPEDFGKEFLDLKCSMKVVDGMDEALEHIQEYSSKHSEAIVSENQEYCDRFLNQVDAAAVYANASTRFTDGAVFGLGAEIGISTQKLHARGPFALEKLVTEKWLISGQGQVRV
jgi:glutamate-5-semialdehyde dehydrogenase